MANASTLAPPGLDEDVVPSLARIEAMADMSQLPDLYETERHLLYVACTRARDYLLLSCAGEASEFLSDMTKQIFGAGATPTRPLQGPSAARGLKGAAPAALAPLG